MERLVIDVPEKKTILVKQLLAELGVIIKTETHIDTADYKQKIASVSVWTDEDLKIFEDTKKAFESLKPEQW